MYISYTYYIHLIYILHLYCILCTHYTTYIHIIHINIYIYYINIHIKKSMYKEELSNGLDQLYDGLCVIVPQCFLSSPNRAASPHGEGSLKGQMPGPWIVGGHNPGYLADQPYQAGSAIEFIAYDDKPAAQGRVLATVEDTIDRDGHGCWLDIQIRCVEDDDLVWWLGKGPGSKYKGRFQLHLCHEQVAKCRRITKKEIVQFHTDSLRTVTALDIKNRVVAAWWLVDPAKGDFESFRASSLKGAAQKAKATPARDLLDFEPSDEGPEDDPGHPGLAGLDAPRSLAEKLEALKRETAPAGQARKGTKKRKKETEAKQPGRRSALRSQSVSKPKQEKAKRPRVTFAEEPLWFGRNEADDSEENEETDESEEEEQDKKKKDKKEKKAKSSSRRSKKKADRGPFGAGRKVSYGSDSGRKDDSESSEDSEESSFQAGVPEKKSQQLVLMEYADHKPGRLAARLLQKMAQIASRTGAPMNSVLAANVTRTPQAAVQYYLTVLYPQHKEKMPLRLQREMRTLAQALDYLGAGELERCADLVAQRLKALELTIHDQGWSRAQFLELIPLETAGLADAEEQRMASKEQLMEAKMRKWLMGQRGGPKGEIQATEDVRAQPGKGKWKGGKKGDRGKGKGAEPPSKDKPPVA